MLATPISPATKPLAVLVIDDNPRDRELLTIYLEQAWPFERELTIETAADGLEALAKMREQCFALIVLDWNLPRNGHGHVLREMRHQGVHIPVIVVSGSPESEITNDLPALGAAYLDKNDLRAETLYNAIGEALHRSQALRQSPPALRLQPDGVRSHGYALTYSCRSVP